MEWTKARCRVERWEEEVVLLDEEMRRVLEYCGWKADWWKGLAAGAPVADSSAVVEGMNAYAAEQAQREEHMAENFAAKWTVVRENARFLIDRVQHGSSAAPMFHSTANPIVIDVDVDDDHPEHEAMGSDFEE